MDSDYIKTLSHDEKLIFLKMLCKLIKADGILDKSELEFLKVCAARFGLSKDEIANVTQNIASINYIEEARRISNRQHALELLKELCFVGNIDDNLNDKELDIIIDIAEAMGIEEEKLVAINRFVLDSIILNRAGKVIMEKDNE